MVKHSTLHGLSVSMPVVIDDRRVWTIRKMPQTADKCGKLIKPWFDVKKNPEIPPLKATIPKISLENEYSSDLKD